MRGSKTVASSLMTGSSDMKQKNIRKPIEIHLEIGDDECTLAGEVVVDLDLGEGWVEWPADISDWADNAIDELGERERFDYMIADAVWQAKLDAKQKAIDDLDYAADMQYSQMKDER